MSKYNIAVYLALHERIFQLARISMYFYEDI